ncbi:MAG TPA: CoA transferase, partial [Mycobacterium sp.]|nr:CoA transferase [Mycobacterium sp.]
LQAYGGLMSVNGSPGGDPLRVGVPIVDITAAHQAFSGILLALLERTLSGRGQLVDIALIDAAVSITHPHSAAYLVSGEVPRRTGAAHPAVAPYQVFNTAEDGRLFVAAATNGQFTALTEVLGRPQLAADVRFKRNQDRVKNLRALLDELEPLLLRCRADELAAALTARGVACGPVNDIAAALSAPQVLHRQMVVRDGHYRGIGVPIKLRRSGSIPPRAPSAQGADASSLPPSWQRRTGLIPSR